MPTFSTGLLFVQRRTRLSFSAVFLSSVCLLLGSTSVDAQVAQVPLFGATVTCGVECGCSSEAGAFLSISASTVSDGTLLLESGFVAGTWEGYVRAYDAKPFFRYLADSGARTSVAWSANFPPPSIRNIHTSVAQNAAVPFEWCALSDSQRVLLDPEYAAAMACPVTGSPVLAYLRGDAALERRNGGTYRDRPGTVLGDVVNSAPVFSKANDQAYWLAPAASYSSSGMHGFNAYRDYVQAKKSSRVPTVMFGANDGMFHVLDARAGLATSGREIFAYVPRATYGALRSLSDPAYVHRYLVDGPVIEGDVWNGSAWRTIVIGTTGAGEPGIFAIDATSPGPSMDARSVLWDIAAADHASAAVRNSMGRTLGAGVIGSVRVDADGAAATQPNGAWAFIVGNGYESRNDTAVLLVFSALDGSLLRAIDTGVGSAVRRNGLGAITPVYDGQRNIVAIYAGDKLGNLWKFDLGSTDPANWRIFNEQASGAPSPLFVASETGATRPIHQAPRVMPHPLGGLYVAFGTGKYFEVGDRESSDDQGIFAIRDRGGRLPIAIGDLDLIVTEEYASGLGVARRLHAPDPTRLARNDKGFWVRLRPNSVSSSRERVVGPLFLDGGMLVVSTFSPEEAATPCSPGGRSYLYRIDLANGFARESFAAETGTTIGVRVDSGVATGFVPLYEPAATGSALTHSVTVSELDAMLSSPRYQVSPETGAVQPQTSGTCAHVGLGIDGSAVRVATKCAGTMPLRSWRLMK